MDLQNAIEISREVYNILDMDFNNWILYNIPVKYPNRVAILKIFIDLTRYQEYAKTIGEVSGGKTTLYPA